jgi:hypothetical protein
MPTIETKTWLALKARVQSLVLTPPLAVVLPRDDAKPPSSGNPARPDPYLEVRHLPNQNERPWIGDDEPALRRGILQLTLKVPLVLKWTEAEQTEVAGLIAEHFPVGLTMISDGLSVHVERHPDVAQGFRDDKDPYWQTPVSVRYWCEA